MTERHPVLPLGEIRAIVADLKALYQPLRDNNLYGLVGKVERITDRVKALGGTEQPKDAPSDEEINERCKQYGEREIFAGAVSRNASQQYAAHDFAQGAYWMRNRLKQANSRTDEHPVLECIRAVIESPRREGEHWQDRDQRALETIEGLLNGTISPSLELFRQRYGA